MKHYKGMKQNEFDQIKTLIKILPIKKVKEVTGRSRVTINYVGKSESFEDYKRLLREKYKQSSKFQQTQSGSTDPKVSFDTVNYNSSNDVLESILAELQKLNKGLGL